MKLSVEAIENGTVIDHIPVGYGLEICRLLKLAERKKVVTLGLNLPSKSMGYKDLIKVEGWEISIEEASQIALFAPHATLNIIRGYQLEKKFKIVMPKSIEKWVICPNPNCITNHEKVETRFTVLQFGERVELHCEFCSRGFTYEN